MSPSTSRSSASSASSPSTPAFDPEGRAAAEIHLRRAVLVRLHHPAGHRLLRQCLGQRAALRAETLIFLLAYVLADSALGFLGMLLIAVFTFIQRLTVWHMLAASSSPPGSLVGLFFASENFRASRHRHLRRRLSTRTLPASTAAPSPSCPTSMSRQTFVSHPVLGVGIGGYHYAYNGYIADLGDELERTGPCHAEHGRRQFAVPAGGGRTGPARPDRPVRLPDRLRPGGGNQPSQIRNALLPYFLVRMSRFGAWFSMELYFFVGLYLAQLSAQPRAWHERGAGGRRQPTYSGCRI